MNFEYFQERITERKSFDYLGNHIEYYLFKSDEQNPHPDEFGVRTDDSALVSDKVPELFRDIIACYEFIELRGIKENNYPQEGTLEGNRILDKLHLDAIKEEMK